MSGFVGLVGVIVVRMPEWLELGLGIPLILAAFGFVVWRRGFGPEDRFVGGNGVPVEGVNDLQRWMAGELIGREVAATVVRGGRELDVRIIPLELQT